VPFCRSRLLAKHGDFHFDEIKTPWHMIDEQRKDALVQKWIKDLDIKVTNPDNPLSAAATSKKVVLAKWILTRPKVLILDAPTVGVDIGAKDGIYKLIHRLSGVGISVLLITDEAPESYYPQLRSRAAYEARKIIASCSFNAERTSIRGGHQWLTFLKCHVRSKAGWAGLSR
jgi:ABC-type uncharacterized transport system ATPase subunit